MPDSWERDPVAFTLDSLRLWLSGHVWDTGMHPLEPAERMQPSLNPSKELSFLQGPRLEETLIALH